MHLCPCPFKYKAYIVHARESLYYLPLNQKVWRVLPHDHLQGQVGQRQTQLRQYDLEVWIVETLDVNDE